MRTKSPEKLVVSKLAHPAKNTTHNIRTKGIFVTEFMNGTKSHSLENSNLVVDSAIQSSTHMRLTQQEQLSLSVVLLIIVLALIGYVVF